MLLIDIYDNFVLDKTIENLTVDTINTYKCIIMLFLNYVGHDTDASLLEDSSYIKKYILYLQSKKLTGKTIHTYVKHIEVFYRYLVNNEYIRFNPVADMRIKYEKKIPQILTIEEIKRLMSILKLRDRFMLMLILDTGIRKKELSVLNVSDIQPDKIYIRSGKGRKDRVVPLSSGVYALLLEYIGSRIADSDHLFQCDNGRPLSYVGVRRVFDRLKNKTGIKRLSPHLLRHTYGTYYIESGGDIKVLQLLLGHSETKTTETYIHLANILNINKYSKHSIINILTEKKDD